MSDAVIIGAGVAGLSSALTLSRAGHSVRLIERDATPLPADPAGAFAWDRRGAPQVRHSHAFLARLRNTLRDRYPDVLAALLDAGATELDFISMLPEDMDPAPHDGDEDLVALACRRTTFEWVLRRVVLAEPHVTLVDGRTVSSLIADGGDQTHVRAAVLDDGTRIDTDIVVAAGGARCNLGALLAGIGVELEEEMDDTGIIYFSRFFHLRDAAEWPAANGPIGGDLGYLKYAVFPGDNGTFSITLAVATDDAEMRRLVLDPEQFVAIASMIPATAAHVDGRADPMTDVQVMARLLNRRRTFTRDDGVPIVRGLSAVGDAHTCTNPLYGRGCSLAFVQAELLASSLAEHPADPVEQGRAYEERCCAEILPWYRAAVAQDAANRSAGGDETLPVVALFRDGLLPAMRTDPVVVRAFLRVFNLLDPPNAMLRDAHVIGRVMAVYQERDTRPPEPAFGPDRAELLAELSRRRLT